MILKDKLLDIAIITYNRPDIVKEWLDESLEGIMSNNYHLSFYDGSSNDYTKNVIEEKTKNNKGFNAITYHHYDSRIRIDERALDGILKSDCEYVWLIGDSRVVDLNKLTPKLLFYLDEGFDYIAVFDDSVACKENKIYTDQRVFFSECFWHCTWLGGLIFRKSIFDSLNQDAIKEGYMKKYYRNDGFSYLGVFYDLLANMNKTKGTVIVADIKEIGMVGKNKNPAWLPRYMEVWCDNLCYLFDQLPAYYDNQKENTLKDTWNIIRLDGYYWPLLAKRKGGLSRDIYKKYKQNGMLSRVSNHMSRIKMISYIPMWVADILLLLVNDYRYIYKVFHKKVK